MKMLALAGAATIGFSGLLVALPAQAATLEAVASADGHVDARYRSSSFGDSPVLKVDGRPDRVKHALLTFTVPGVPAGERLESVTLRLRSKESSSRGVNVYRTGAGWSESSLTWRTEPTERVLLGTSDALRAGTTEEVALDTSKVVPGQVLSLRLESAGRLALSFVSSEGLAPRRPALRVGTSSTATPPVVQPPVVQPPVVQPPVVQPPVVQPPVVLPPVPEPPVTPPVPDLPTPEPPVTPPTPEPPAQVAKKVIGMSAPAHLWDTRIREVGAGGVTSRRIFADLSATGSSQLPLIRRAVADGMTPVISYKVPDPATMAAGGYDAWLDTLRAQLDGLGAPVTATYWHEPHGDMTPAQFREGSTRFLEHVRTPDVAVGPIMNGWLLDNLRSTTRANFAEYTSPALLRAWDFVGVDSYHEGTASAPSSTLLPARAVPQLAAWLDAQGFPDKRIVLGEYNGFTGAAMQQAREWILDTPELWIALIWNVDNTTFSVLTGDRRTAFQETKADQRALR